MWIGRILSITWSWGSIFPQRTPLRSIYIGSKVFFNPRTLWQRLITLPYPNLSQVQGLYQVSSDSLIRWTPYIPFVVPKCSYLCTYNQKLMKRHSTITKDLWQVIFIVSASLSLTRMPRELPNLEPIKQNPNKTKKTNGFHKFTHQREPRTNSRTHLPWTWVTPSEIPSSERPEGWTRNSVPIISLRSSWWLYLFTIENHPEKVVPSGLAVIALPLKLTYLESLNLGLVSLKVIAEKLVQIRW